MSIGELAGRTGVTTPTIRYYESVGLLRAASRTGGGHRVYGPEDEVRVTFARRCRAFGFSVEQVKALVAVRRSTARSCLEARDLAVDHLAEVRRRLAQLRALEGTLQEFVEECEARCEGGPGAGCTILGDLGRPV